MPRGIIKRLVTDRGFGFIQAEQKVTKTCSSIAASFKGWTIVPLEKGKK